MVYFQLFVELAIASKIIFPPNIAEYIHTPVLNHFVSTNTTEGITAQAVLWGNRGFHCPGQTTDPAFEGRLVLFDITSGWSLKSTIAAAACAQVRASQRICFLFLFFFLQLLVIHSV
jgi:hypothetical protein